MTAATCSTCRHWRAPDPPDEWTEESPYGVCKIAESSDGKPVIPLAPARAMDTSGYHASLGTMATFGCVLHAAVGSDAREVGGRSAAPVDIARRPEVVTFDLPKYPDRVDLHPEAARILDEHNAAVFANLEQRKNRALSIAGLVEASGFIDRMRSLYGRKLDPDVIATASDMLVVFARRALLIEGRDREIRECLAVDRERGRIDIGLMELAALVPDHVDVEEQIERWMKR